MKKTYQTPRSTVISLPANHLCLTITSDESRETDGENGGWSKKFSGGLEDDADSKDFVWTND